MHTTIEIDGRPVEVTTSKDADTVLSNRHLPLTVEMELFFSYPLCKKVRFLAEKEESLASVHVNDKLAVRFRPVMIHDCSREQLPHCPVTDFPIVKPEPYIPKWLHIDFHHGHWLGEFGYLA